MCSRRIIGCLRIAAEAEFTDIRLAGCAARHCAGQDGRYEVLRSQRSYRRLVRSQSILMNHGRFPGLIRSSAMQRDHQEVWSLIDI